MRTWSSAAPCFCDCCGDVISDEFVDGRTVDGMWAIMCPQCHKDRGVGLGTGRGQRYKQVGADYINAEDLPLVSGAVSHSGPDTSTSGGPPG